MGSKINYNKQEIDSYLRDLRVVGSLSSLFSDSEIPLLHYRVTENLYCSSFGAENLARADVSADAKLRKYGIGIKTFTEGNKRTFQKVAEFNSQVELYHDLKPEEKVKKIAELRNRRIQFTKDVHDIHDMIYHCIVRNKNGFYLFEEDMFPIDIEHLHFDGVRNHIYKFHDGISEYQFNESKSTLYKRFITNDYFASIPVDVLENPMAELRRLNLTGASAQISEVLILPLYTYIRGTSIKIVAEKSGLNQWNASGRKRHPDEVYIPYPADIRAIFDSYFPNRDTPFDVLLPNGKILSMKVCQSDGKALMSNPNKSLGEWILRDILKVPYGKLVTYEMLLEIGIDAIIFEKINGKYRLNFAEVGKFEEFRDRILCPDYE